MFAVDPKWQFISIPFDRPKLQPSIPKSVAASADGFELKFLLTERGSENNGATV